MDFLQEQTNSRFVSAVCFNKIELVKELIKEGADINYRNTIIIASKHGHKEICEILIENGIDVNVRDGCGMPALYYAAFNGHKEICELLLNNGADVESKNNYGNSTILISTICKKNKEICELLISKGADINVKNIFGETPLLYASYYYEDKEICELLNENGAKFDFKAFKFVKEKYINSLYSNCLKYLNINAFNRRKHLLACYDSYIW